MIKKTSLRKAMWTANREKALFINNPRYYEVNRKVDSGSRVYKTWELRLSKQVDRVPTRQKDIESIDATNLIRANTGNWVQQITFFCTSDLIEQYHTQSYSHTSQLLFAHIELPM